MKASSQLPAAVLVLSLALTNAFAQLPPPEVCPAGADCNTPAPCGSGCADQDNDGLCDSWEIAGGIDLDGDGQINQGHHGDDDDSDVNDDELDVPLPGASPLRPDVYVQYDYMVMPGKNGHSHRPTPEAIQAVVDAFARQGMALHVIRGHRLQHHRVVTFEQVDPACTGNDAVNFYDLKSKSLQPGRAIAYHYAIFGHYNTCDSVAHCAQCPVDRNDPLVFGSTGKAELPGNDFIVSTGVFADFGLTPTVEQEAGVFMHELGHNFGLQHGGSSSFPEFKPNYLSVVNPNFTFTGIPVAALPGSTTPIGCGTDRDCPDTAICAQFTHTCTRIDYSQTALPDLNELSLDERAGIAAGTNDITTYNCPDGTPVSGAASGPIDWNCNGNNAETNVIADINYDGEFNDFPFLITGHRDWGNLNFHFQCTAKGAGNAPPPSLWQSEPSPSEFLRRRDRRDSGP